ncbi:hypothetical protein GCM10007891_09410 [Methylophaga thalassica]|uniref:Uncharacterized protein n=1 Tax=Methylophaga thalassica TaxID=40223 RepID=A0ABQ5TUK4_9GAMM|nr:hypothetical protein GCM10007891_09410 [Methylophaga thalassica]
MNAVEPLKIERQTFDESIDSAIFTMRADVEDDLDLLYWSAYHPIKYTFQLFKELIKREKVVIMNNRKKMISRY